MKSIFKLSFLGIALLAITSLAIASHHYHGGKYMMPSWDMTEMDINQDGELTFEEYSAIPLEKLTSGFEMIDKDGNGFINRQEWIELLEAHGLKSDG
jgi:hypothetical protein